MDPTVRWLARALLSGLAGTTAMTVSSAVQERLRSTDDLPVDYDVTSHVTTAAATVLHVRPRSHAARTGLFALTHWGYGSAVAIGHRALVTRTSRPRAAGLFMLGCQAMAWTLFPTVGDTPPPWRWRRDVLASSIGHHAVYVAAVAATDAWLSSRPAHHPAQHPVARSSRPA